MMPWSGDGNAALARRIREVRNDLYGENGGPHLAEALNLPIHTWMNYESGVIIPALVVLRFINVCGVSPGWLLTGEGKRFLEGDRPGVPAMTVTHSAYCDQA
jgi:hypothetical protein